MRKEILHLTNNEQSNIRKHIEARGYVFVGLSKLRDKKVDFLVNKQGERIVVFNLDVIEGEYDEVIINTLCSREMIQQAHKAVANRNGQVTYMEEIE